MWRLLLKLHFGVLLAGFTGVFGRLITCDAFILVISRFALALSVLFIYLEFTKKLVKFTLRQKLQTVFIGALLGIHLLLFFLSIKLSNISIGTITLAVTCFFTAILEPLILKTKLKVQNFLYSLLIVLGLFLIFNFDTQYRLGIAIGFLSALFTSAFTIFNKKFTSCLNTYTTLNYEMLGGLIILLLVSPIYLYFNSLSDIHLSYSDIGYLVLLSTVFTVLLYLLMIRLTAQLSAFTISLTLNLEPVYSILWAMILFNEQKELNASFYVGVALVFLSVFLQNRSVKRGYEVRKTS